MQVNDGEDWGANRAWQTLAYALDQLNNGSTAFNEIHIKMGSPGHVYTPGALATDTFVISKPVIIRGGYDASGARADGAVTTLSGDLGGGVHSRHIMTVSGNFGGVALVGLRFTGGDAREDPGVKGGAALLVTDPAETKSGEYWIRSLAASECAFEENDSETCAGAVYLHWWDAHFSRCEFRNNRAHGDPDLSPPLPEGQNGFAYGGAIYLLAGALTVDRTLFSGNALIDAGGGKGGAIFAEDGAGRLTCANCVFDGNSASCGQANYEGLTGMGGAVFAHMGGHPWENGDPVVPEFRNCVFRGNGAGGNGIGGGALHCPDGAFVTACTLGNNHVETGLGAGLYVGGSRSHSVELRVWNSVLWGNSSAAIEDGDDPDHQFVVNHDWASISIASSCVRGLDLGTYGNGNIAADPRYADGDLRLRWCSPARDAGNSSLLPEDEFDLNENSNYTEPHSTDLDGKLSPRVKGGALDMGAFEHAEPAETGCLGDLDNSGEVDGADLGQLLGAWGACPDCIADIALCDGAVDGADLGQLLGAWGACPGGMMAMSSEGGGSSIALLMVYLGADTQEQMVSALTAMDFQQMSALLEIFLGN